MVRASPQKSVVVRIDMPDMCYDSKLYPTWQRQLRSRTYPAFTLLIFSEAAYRLGSNSYLLKRSGYDLVEVCFRYLGK